MALIPWRNKRTEVGLPEASPAARLRTEMDRLWESFLREPFGALDWPFPGRQGWLPAVDVNEDDQEVTVRAEIPGIDPKDIEVSLTGNQLLLAGEKKESSEKKDKSSYRAECSYGAFRRTVELPDNVDGDNISADYANGVLSIHVKKTAPAPVKRIEVKTAK